MNESDLFGVFEENESPEHSFPKKKRIHSDPKKKKRRQEGMKKKNQKSLNGKIIFSFVFSTENDSEKKAIFK